MCRDAFFTLPRVAVSYCISNLTGESSQIAASVQTYLCNDVPEAYAAAKGIQDLYNLKTVACGNSHPFAACRCGPSAGWHICSECQGDVSTFSSFVAKLLG